MTLLPLLPVSFCLVLYIGVTIGQHNYNCPAPRSPKNGLSFIFQQGKEVHFKCHPGFSLIGNPVSICVNNVWATPVPDCAPEKGDNSTNKEGDEDLQKKNSSGRPLFSWDSPSIVQQSTDAAPVPESRRLPLINGLWRPRYTLGPKVSNQTNATGRFPDKAAVNNTRDLYTQELKIAEVRQRQQEETLGNSVLRGSDHYPRGPANRNPVRYKDLDAADRRRWRIVQARQSPNILYAGSRAASAHRGETGDEDNLETSETIMGMFNWAEGPQVPSSVRIPHHAHSTTSHRAEVSNDEFIELRQRQIAEVLRNQMAANLPRGSNSDKAGLIEDARRRHYEDLQLLRAGSSSPKAPVTQNYLGDASRDTTSNLRRTAALSDDDYLLASGAEVHEQTLNPDESVSEIVLKPFHQDQVFKPTYNERDDTNLENLPKRPSLRGDMGNDIEYTTELPMEYTEQYSYGPAVPNIAYRQQLFNPGQSQHRASFSAEKAAQVEATIRHFLRPRPQIYIHTTYSTPSVPTYHSNLVPKSTPRPVTARPTYPTRRPTIKPTRSPVMDANGDKAAQTEEAMYQQYLQAEHLRRIMEYERERLEYERRQELERRNIMAEERQIGFERRSQLVNEDQSENELVKKPDEEIYFSNTSEADADLDYANRVAVLASIDREWLTQLSPDLQSRYLEEVLTSRRKQSDESQHAQDFMRRYMDNLGSVQNSTFPNVSTRTSASGHVTTIIESHNAASPNGTDLDVISSKADLSCLQSRSGRRLFIRAPKVAFAYVYRYERKKHSHYPFKPYLLAEYRCRRGFTMVQSERNSLFCRRMEWVGVKPQCVKTH